MNIISQRKGIKMYRANNIPSYSRVDEVEIELKPFTEQDAFIEFHIFGPKFAALNS